MTILQPFATESVAVSIHTVKSTTLELLISLSLEDKKERTNEGEASKKTINF